MFFTKEKKKLLNRLFEDILLYSSEKYKDTVIKEIMPETYRKRDIKIIPELRIVEKAFSFFMMVCEVRRM